MIMKTRFYCLVAAFIFVLIFASCGEAAMMAPLAEGQQGAESSVSSKQVQGTYTASSEQNAATPTTNQEEAAPSAPSSEGSSPASGEQNVSTPPTNQQEASSATNPEGQDSQQAKGAQTVSPPAANQQEAASSAPSSEGSLPAAARQESAPAVTYPLGQASSPAATEQNAPATDQQGTSQTSSPPTEGEQSATSAPAASAQDASPATGAPQGFTSPTYDASSTPLSLKESIEIALQKSPTIQSAQSAIKEAQYRRLGAVSDFLPQVNMQYTYTRLDKTPYFYYPPPINTTVTAGSKDNYNWNTSVTQPVFAGGALINSYLLAKIGVDSAKVELEKTKRDLVLQVKIAYYGVLTAEKGVEVAQQAVAQVESHYTVAKAFFEVGITAKNDVLQVEVELAQARQNLIAAEHALEVARAVFNTLMRRDINEPVRLAETLEYIPLTINMNALYEEAFRERPEIKLSDLGIQSAKKEVGIAASKLFPQLSIVYTYERLGDEPWVEGSRFSRMHDWNVMGVAQWTVWDWGKAWWGIGESKARVFQAECALQEVKDSVMLDVQAAALKVTEARKNIQVAETAVSQAEEDFRINEERYKGQVATTTDVLDSLTRLTQARTNYYSALSDYNIAKARLQRAIGSM
jgi:outer membrane protein